MPSVERPGCRLSWRVIDAVPPWRPASETILFPHGIGATGALFSDWVPALCGAELRIFPHARHCPPSSEGDHQDA